MELFPASDQQQLEYIKRIIDRSDYYVVIVGGRYGSLAENGLSYTENEFDYARSKGIPTLAFVPAKPESIPVGKSEADPAKREKLERFKEKLKGRMVDHWVDTHDLCLKVVTAVAHAINLTPRPGWIRGDQAIDPKVLQDLERLRIENRELREQLSTLDNSEIRFNPRFMGPDDFIELTCDGYTPTPYGSREATSEFKTAASIGSIFVGLYDNLLVVPGEHQLLQTIGRMLAELAGRKDKDTQYALTSHSLQKLRTQLEALALIEVEGVGSLSGGGYRRWRPSEKGKRFALSKLAILKPETNPSSSVIE
jgi:hypothetical protein